MTPTRKRAARQRLRDTSRQLWDQLDPEDPDTVDDLSDDELDALICEASAAMEALDGRQNSDSEGDE